VGDQLSSRRSAKHVPKYLVIDDHYLDSVDYSFSSNISRPAHPIITRYFNSLHLGFQGYCDVTLTGLRNAYTLSRALMTLSDRGIYRSAGCVRCTSTISDRPLDGGDVEVYSPSGDCGVHLLTWLQLYEPGLPIVVFRFSDESQQKHPEIRRKWTQTLLRMKGWCVAVLVGLQGCYPLTHPGCLELWPCA